MTGSRKTLRSLGLLLALAAGLPAVAFASSVNVKFTAWMPKGHATGPYFESWAKEVTEQTEGRVKVSVDYTPVAKPAQYMDMVRRGLVDATYGVHGYQPGRFFLTQAAEMPFLANRSEVLSLAYWRTHQKLLAQHGEHEGVRLLTLFTHGPGVLFNRVKAIEKVEDFDGMKLRVGGGISHEVAKRLGVVPLLAPSTSSYEMLSTGVVDGLMFPADSVPVYNLAEILRYGTRLDGGFYNVSFFVVMSERVWNRMSKEDQEVVTRLSGEHMARGVGRVWDQADLDGYEAMAKAGMKVQDASSTVAAGVRERVAGVEGEWVAKAKERGVDGEEIMRTLREEIAKAQAEIGSN